MNHTQHIQPRQYSAATQRAVANAEATEWGALPALGRAWWAGTVAAGLDTVLPAIEPLSGVSIREVHEPGVFRRFFGRSSAR